MMQHALKEGMISQDWRWRGVAALTAFKILLVPAYHSTDFEVHRNWLAVTSSLPFTKWYIEATSQWTLDYPPLFAWFEWLLAKAACLVDRGMLQISKHAYTSEATILFQRGSVILADGVLVSAAWYATRRFGEPQRSAAFLLIVANAGLLLVDHIHFQYNGLLLGILLWSIACIEEGLDVLAAALFALLLNMKHLLACLTPLYLVYLLRHYCRGKHALMKFAQLGTVVIAICTASFGPVILAGQLPQVLSRLFPFKRGLMHAYWAANLWALYGAADRALVALLLRLGIPVQKPVAIMTGGLVQVSSFAVLPDVQAGHCLLLALVTMAPALVAVWRRAHSQAFAAIAAYTCLCSFMAGYHVHEKAVLMVVLPLVLPAVRACGAARAFMLASMAGHCALLPLLFTRNEYPIKVLIVLLYTIGSHALLDRCLQEEQRGAAMRSSRADQQLHGYAPGQPLLSGWGLCYTFGLAAVELYCCALHAVVAPGLPFLPLLLTSVYCAVGLTLAWGCLGAFAVQPVHAPKERAV